MSEENTKEMERSKSFEERVFLRFDAVDDRLNTLDFRVERLEARQYDTRPIWERLIIAIDETKESLQAGFSEVNEKLGAMNDRLEGVDQRLETVDSRLETVDHRLETLDHRVEGVEGRFDRVDERFTALSSEVDQGLRKAARHQDILYQAILEFRSDHRYLEGRLDNSSPGKLSPNQPL
jgi:chaperonin cofactor prefoldin